MAKWQQQCRVDWDAADGRNGGAQQTVWEVLLEMERFDGKAKARGLGPEPGRALRASESPCGVGLGNALQLPKEDLSSVLQLFRAPEEGTVRRMCGRAVENHHGHSARVQVELLAVAHCVAGCVE